MDVCLLRRQTRLNLVVVGEYLYYKARHYHYQNWIFGPTFTDDLSSLALCLFIPYLSGLSEGWFTVALRAFRTVKFDDVKKVKLFPYHDNSA
jgi:hypothetical protein